MPGGSWAGLYAVGGRPPDSGEGRSPGRWPQSGGVAVASPLTHVWPPAWPCSFADINECLQLPQTCAFQCQNLQGGYRCLCPPGQTLLRDGKTCVPLERSDQNVTTVSHRGPLGPWLRPRAPFPRGSSHAWVSLRPGSRAPSSLGRAWCPAGFIRQNGICTGKARPQPFHWGHSSHISLGSGAGLLGTTPCVQHPGIQGKWDGWHRWTDGQLLGKAPKIKH